MNSARGPSGSAQNNLFKNSIFGIYRLSEIDKKGNAIYKKVSAIQDTDLVNGTEKHFHIFKGEKGFWMVR